jgi:HK97 family phage prohead protease
VELIFSRKDFSFAASIKDVDGKKGIFTGYASHFGNVDSDGDIIRKGAFAKTIKENGPKSTQPRIKHLMNHDPSQPIARIIDLKEDETGLAYESQAGTHTLGVDFIKMVESGLISEHSIGFRTLKRNQLQSYEDYNKRPDGGWYEITELKLFEISSLTAWGANPLTPITGLKSIVSVDVILERQKAIEKFCRSTDASDENH